MMLPVHWLQVYLGHHAPDVPMRLPQGATQIQKAMFLFAQAAEIPNDQKYTFRPDQFGPMSPAIYPDLQQLERMHIVSLQGNRYAVTSRGEQEAQAMQRLPEIAKQLSLLEVIHGLIAQLSHEDLLRAIYAAYPAMTTNAIRTELIADGSQGATGPLRTLLTAQELRTRAESLDALREIDRGDVLNREEFLSLMNGV